MPRDTPAHVIIRAAGLALEFDAGRVRALDAFDLEVGAGEFVAIVGPSGCGKSSLLNLIGLLDEPTAGEIQFRGQAYATIRDRSLFRRRHFGFVFQAFHLIPTLSALDNVVVATIGCPGAQQAHARRAHELLVRLGLGDRLAHFPSRMSGGERQRVAIARALVNDPDVLLADEPTGNLDSGNAAQVLDLIGTLRGERRRTVILATHDPEVSRRADRVVHLRDGRLDERARAVA